MFCCSACGVARYIADSAAESRGAEIMSLSLSLSLPYVVHTSVLGLSAHRRVD